MEPNLLNIAAVFTPFLVIPATLIWGLVSSLLGVLVLAAVMLIGVYLYFGVWAMIEGESVWETLRTISFILPAAGVILGWVLMWSAIYGGIAAGLRWAWIRFRKVRA